MRMAVIMTTMGTMMKPKVMVMTRRSMMSAGGNVDFAR